MLTANDLLNKSFEKASFGGYKTADVEAFMDDLRIFLSGQSKEKLQLKKQLDEVSKKSEEMASKEDSIKNTLLSAQELADKITKEAKEKADEIIKNAKSESDSMINSAKIKTENLIDCAESEVEMRKNEAESIKNETYEFKLRLMKLYRSQLELINEIPAEIKKEEPKPVILKDVPNDEKAKEEKSAETTDDETEKTSENEEITSKQDDIEGSEKTETSEDIDDRGSDEEKNDEKSEEVTEPVTIENSSDLQKVEKAPIDGKVEASTDSLSADVTNNDGIKEVQEEAKTAKEVAATKSSEPEIRTIKLNLKFNQQTGEYIPLNSTKGEKENNDIEPAGMFNYNKNKGKNGNGLKFGADYNIKTDSFNHNK